MGLVLGIIFLIIGILGFIPNPFVGDGAIFQTGLAHNLVHLITGLILVLVSGKGSCRAVLKVLGIIYVILALIGWFTAGSGTLLGFLSVNGADHWLHLVLGLLLFWGGILKSGSGTPIANSTSQNTQQDNNMQGEQQQNTQI